MKRRILIYRIFDIFYEGYYNAHKNVAPLGAELYARLSKVEFNKANEGIK